MNQVLKRAIKSPSFKIVSSVRLAIPIMATLSAVVGWGTLLESRYNAQVASILIYRTQWFWMLIILLAINVLSAVLVRIPLKREHTGFVITHIGLLTLIFGAGVTAVWGIDGVLEVPEGQDSNRVQISDYSVRIMDQSGQVTSHPIRKVLYEMGPSQLQSVLPPESGLIVDKFIPFGKHEQVLSHAGNVNRAVASETTAIEFRLKSQFFDVTESLQSQKKPEISMGPARFRLVTSLSQDKSHPFSSSYQKRKTHKPKASNNNKTLNILNRDDGALLKAVPIPNSGSVQVSLGDRKIRVVRVFKSAVVNQGKLIERTEPGSPNPALELEILQGGQQIREVVFGLHPGFALNAKGVAGLKFTYEVGEEMPPLPSTEQQSGGNLVEFNSLGQGTVHVALFKNGEKVFESNAKANQELATPWMGMKLTLLKVYDQAELVDQFTPIQLRERSPLPPSAIFVRARGSDATEGTWLIEGEPGVINTPSGLKQLIYGRSEIELPFSLHLEKFSKIDYPGTATPMSYESKIRINNQADSQVISMNDPLKRDNFTVYQSSFQLQEGAPAISIFSVNQDPGRPIKYAGSLILCAGIILFTGMRSRLGWLKRNRAFTSLLLLFLLSASGVKAQAEGLNPPVSPEIAQQKFVEVAAQIPSTLATLPIQSHGRIKPLETFARESLLYVTGKYRFWNLNPLQIYLGLIISNSASYTNLINIRDPELRIELELSRDDRSVSIERLGTTRLEILAKPLIERQEKNDSSLNSHEKAILEAVQQLWLARSIISGEHLFSALNLNPEASQNLSGHGPGVVADSGAQGVQNRMQAYLRAINQNEISQAAHLAQSLLEVAKAQPVPSLFQRSMNTLDLEVSYYHWQPFFIAGILYFIFGLILVVGRFKWLSTQRVFIALTLPILLHIGGFAVRVWITGFAPVTNMYGTMIWMALGVVLFGSVLVTLYRNFLVFGILLIGASLTLLLAENIPLTLSPDLDPVVAVLRSNFWLTIHVLTISISYAAFTIAMLIGNTVLVRNLFKAVPSSEMKQLSHIAYRAIQLGVFLLTTGIILGGIWADYSWGRFWGWDPKETWALIADLGFIMLLHGRLVGWATPFLLLSLAPVAYLLVIMAWYGVNFILAAGLHSYGFSSGGALAVAIFIGVQLILLVSARIPIRSARAN